MTTSKQGRFLLVDGKLYERRVDGSLAPLVGQTDFRRLDAMTDEEVEANALSDPDALPMTDEEWAQGEINASFKIPVGLRLDSDVLDWFKSNGKGYQSRINVVLRKYMEAHRKSV
ncbi:MAG: BrnA antitoxin family protein [Allorhizobium sp.]